MKTVALLAWVICDMAARVVANTPPRIEVIPDVVTTVGVGVEGIPIRIADSESPPEVLEVRAVSSNPMVLSVAGFRWSGTGEVRWLSLQPAAGRRGVVMVTVEARDPEGASGRQTFRFIIEQEPAWLAIDPIPPQRGWEGGPTLTVPIHLSWEDSADANHSVTATVSTNGWFAGDNSLRWGPSLGGKQRTLWIAMPAEGAGVGQVTVVAQRSAGDLNAAATFPLVVEKAPFRPDETWRLPVALERARVAVDWDGSGSLEFVAGGGQEIQVWQETSLGYAKVATAPFNALPVEVGVVDVDGDGQPDVVARSVYNLGLWRGTSGAAGPALERVVLPREVQDVLIRGMIWRDLDADGDVDALIVQATQSLILAQETNGWTVRTLAGPTMGWPIAAADADGDGDVDLLASTSSAPTGDVLSSAGIWWNDGRGRFATNGPPILTGLIRGAGWEDLDGNGLPEPWLLVQNSANSHSLVTFRRNLGGWQESGRVATLAGDGRSWVWADLDSDGVPDAAVPAESEGTSLAPQSLREPVLRWFRGDGQGGFLEAGAYRMTARTNSMTLVPDGRGQLDVAVGRTLFRNQFLALNPPPAPPSGTRSWVVGKRVRLSWLDAWDLNQPGGLTYNLRIGTRPGAEDVMASLSRMDGTRRGLAHGNVGWRTFLDLDLARIRPGPLYWSVQAVDASFAGGPFSEEQVIGAFPQDGSWTVRLDLNARRMSWGHMLTQLFGTSWPARPFLLETSVDLLEWSSVQWIQPHPEGQFAVDYPDPEPGFRGKRFFRAWVPGPAESEP
jgi:hypothetical protein